VSRNGPPIVKDYGYRETLALFRKLGIELDVGVFGPKAEERHKDSDATVGEIAVYHEFGLGVPERSFIRAWFEQNSRTVIDDMRAGLIRVLKRELTPEQLADLLGQKYVGQIQARMAAGIPPPLAESTIARKGSSIPLIDTGQLRSAVTYEVRRLLR
jgi:hypothetical protein